MKDDDKAALAEEERRVRRLRRMADLAIIMVARTRMPMEEAMQVFQSVREAALKMFPDKADAFNLIYGSRFRRLLVKKYGLL